MEVKLWKSFSKRKNSTKRPTGQPDATKTVTLKEKCSTSYPSFFLADAEIYSYLQWGDAYYFIDKVSFDINGAQYINCSIDVLATWKDQILNMSAFVKYSTSNYNLELSDNRIVPEVDMIVQTASETSDIIVENDHLTNEVVILTALNNAGGIMRWVLDESSLKTVMAELQQQALSLVGSLLLDESAAMSSIIDALRIPLMPAYIPSAGPANIGFGDWYSSYQAAYTVGNMVFERKEITIPWVYSDFRKGAPYTELFLELPFVGVVELNPQDFFDSGIVDIRACVNLYNGHIDYKITDGADHYKTVATFSAQCGGHVPMGMMQVQNSSQAVSGALGMATKLGALGVASNLDAENALVKGHPFEMSDMDYFNHATSIGSSMVDFLQASNTQSANIIGSYSGGYGEALMSEYNVIVRAKPSSTEPMNLNALYGNPCGKVLPMANLTGYVQTEGFSIDTSAIKEVRNMINMAMDSGVYIE